MPASDKEERTTPGRGPHRTRALISSPSVPPAEPAIPQQLEPTGVFRKADLLRAREILAKQPKAHSEDAPIPVAILPTTPPTSSLTRFQRFWLALAPWILRTFFGQRPRR